KETAQGQAWVAQQERAHPPVADGDVMSGHAAGFSIIPPVNEAVMKAVASEQLRYSLAGRLGHAVEPVIKPLGFDWKMGVGLVGAFAAPGGVLWTLALNY